MAMVWAPWSRLQSARTGGRDARLGPCCGLQTAFAGRRCSCGTPCGFGSSPGGPRRRARSMNMTAGAVAPAHSAAPEGVRSTAHGRGRPAGPAPAGSPSRRTQPHAAPARQKARGAVTWLGRKREEKGIGQAKRRLNTRRTVHGSVPYARWIAVVSVFLYPLPISLPNAQLRPLCSWRGGGVRAVSPARRREFRSRSGGAAPCQRARTLLLRRGDVRRSDGGSCHVHRPGKSKRTTRKQVDSRRSAQRREPRSARNSHAEARRERPRVAVARPSPKAEAGHPPAHARAFSPRRFRLSAPFAHPRVPRARASKSKRAETLAPTRNTSSARDDVRVAQRIAATADRPSFETALRSPRDVGLAPWRLRSARPRRPPSRSRSGHRAPSPPR
jgi:hypothetical protein